MKCVRIMTVAGSCCRLFDLSFRRMILAHPSGHWQHLQSVSLPLTVEQIELTWVQSGPVGLNKNCLPDYSLLAA
jgi:hypothetical protein